MAETERLVTFHLLGQDFSFYTGASEEEMDSILGLVRRHIEDANRSGGAIPVSKVAVLACLNLASRYVKLKQDFDEFQDESEVRLRLVNEKLQDVLSQEKDRS